MKPVLIGLHLGFAILGIDAFLWLLGEVVANTGSPALRTTVAALGLIGYLGCWLIGGHYYIKYYGSSIKPIIKAGNAPWAHDIVMELKEHVFLFVVPLAIVIFLLVQIDPSSNEGILLQRPLIGLCIVAAGLGLSIGLMGFIISAAARWSARS